VGTFQQHPILNATAKNYAQLKIKHAASFIHRPPPLAPPQANPNQQNRRGEPTHIKGTTQSFLAMFPELLGPDHLTQPYAENGWVFACIRALASSVTSVPPQLWQGDPRKNSKSATLLPETDPLYQLLAKRPNVNQTINQFRDAGLTHRKLDGEDIWFLLDENNNPIRPGEVPAQIVPWRGRIVDILRDEMGFPAAYRWPWQITPSFTAEAPISITDRLSTDPPTHTQAPDFKWFPKHAVVHFITYDPNNPARGIGEAEVLLRDMNMEFAAQRYQEALLQNSGDPGGWIIFDRDMDKGVRQKAQSDLDSIITDKDNAGKYQIVSGSGAKVQVNPMKPKDMEYTKLLEATRDKILSVMGVPPPIVGVLENASYNNIETAVEIFWEGPSGVQAYLTNIEEVINESFIRRLSNSRYANVFLRHDLTDVPALQEDMDSKLRLWAELAAGANGLSDQGAADLVGIPTPKPLSTVVFMPAATSTLETVVDPPEPPPMQAPAAAPPGAPDKPDSQLAEPRTPKASPTQLRSTFVPSEWQKTFESKILEPREKAMRKDMNRYFRSYHLALRSRLKAIANQTAKAPSSTDTIEKEFSLRSIIDLLLLDPIEWAKKLFDRSMPHIERSYNEATADMDSALGSDHSEPDSHNTRRIIERQVLKLSGDVNGTLAKQVSKIISDHLATANPSLISLPEAIADVLPELTDDLKRVFANKEARANAIARTEVGKAVATGRYNIMKADGIRSHRWSTSGDDAVRHTHVDLNGQIRPIGEEFKHNLLYPKDPNGPPEEIINCRCQTIPVLVEDR